MKNQWVYYMLGYVRVEIRGKDSERFINECVAERLTIWNISRLNDETLVANVLLRDVWRMKPLLKMTSCHVSFTERFGLPFLYKKAWSRIGLTVGLFLGLVVIFLLSNIVWSISVVGASPKAEHELRKIIAEIGIERGKFIFLMPNVEHIQKEVMEKLDGVTWVGVRQNGTNYEFEVVEQLFPEQAEEASPRHIVATKKAVIHRLFVEKGSAKVKQNELVEKGELLVSGWIGMEDAPLAVAAKGKVLGEVWYKSTVVVPLKQTMDTLTGEQVAKHYLSIFGVELPIWGFQKEPFVEKEMNEKVVPISFLHWQLPIQYKQVSIFEKERFVREYTEEEAVQLALIAGKYELQKKLQEDATIKSENVLHKAVENGKVKVFIHYEVIEDITGYERINQGE